MGNKDDDALDFIGGALAAYFLFKFGREYIELPFGAGKSNKKKPSDYTAGGKSDTVQYTNPPGAPPPEPPSLPFKFLPQNKSDVKKLLRWLATPLTVGGTVITLAGGTLIYRRYLRRGRLTDEFVDIDKIITDEELDQMKKNPYTMTGAPTVIDSEYGPLTFGSVIDLDKQDLAITLPREEPEIVSEQNIVEFVNDPLQQQTEPPQETQVAVEIENTSTKDKAIISQEELSDAIAEETGLFVSMKTMQVFHKSRFATAGTIKQKFNSWVLNVYLANSNLLVEGPLNIDPGFNINVTSPKHRVFIAQYIRFLLALMVSDNYIRKEKMGFKLFRLFKKILIYVEKYMDISGVSSIFNDIENMVASPRPFISIILEDVPSHDISEEQIVSKLRAFLVILDEQYVKEILNKNVAAGTTYTRYQDFITLYIYYLLYKLISSNQNPIEQFNDIQNVLERMYLLFRSERNNDNRYFRDLFVLDDLTKTLLKIGREIHRKKQEKQKKKIKIIED